MVFTSKTGPEIAPNERNELPTIGRILGLFWGETFFEAETLVGLGTDNLRITNPF